MLAVLSDGDETSAPLSHLPFDHVSDFLTGRDKQAEKSRALFFCLVIFVALWSIVLIRFTVDSFGWAMNHKATKDTK